MKGVIIISFDGLPITIGWELTLSCNLNCRHCGSSAGQARHQELTLAESLSICDQFPELLVQEVGLSGGEPLLNPNWEPIASRLKDLGIQVEMITNGLELTGDIADKMSQAGLSTVGVSLDGLSETHNYVRGRGDSFQRAVEAMKNAKNAGIVVTAITTVNALNISDLTRLAPLLISVGVSGWQIQPLVPFGRSRDAFELLLTEQDYMRLGDFIQEWAPKTEREGLRIFTADSLGYFAEFETCPKPWRGCNAGMNGCAITSDGKVKGCLSMPNSFVDGDLRERALWDIWFDPDAFPYTRHFTFDQLGSNCHDCDRHEDCQGGCSSKSLGLTGHLHNDPMCYYRLGKENRTVSETVTCS